MSETTTAIPTGGRERILEEALARFTTAGFAAVSMQQIAGGAGVTKATLYHHFRDKEDLFLAVLQTALSRSEASLVEAVGQGSAVEERLRSVARYLFSGQRSDIARLFADLRQHVSPERQEPFWRSAWQPWTCLEHVLSDGVASGEIAPVDPELAARVFWGAAVMQLHLVQHRGDLAQPDNALADGIVDLIMRGLTPR